MPRMNPIEHERAEGKAKALLDGVKKSLGTSPNLMCTLAQAPAALEAYLGFNRSLGSGRLSSQLRELIALAVSGANGCDYCAAAHAAIGEQLGLSADEIGAGLHGLATEPHIEAALEFARRIVAERGWVSDEDVQRVRDAGYSDGDIVEIIATVAGTIFTNYFNHIAQTEMDFPPVGLPDPASAPVSR